MDFSVLTPVWLDNFLIAPFRWPGDPYMGIWLGSLLIALYAVLIGECISAALYYLHHRHYNSLHDDMIKYHNLSVQALHSGNKEAYLAANTVAREQFGKSFFTQAGIGMGSLVPVPFALGWMSLRFEGIGLYKIPGLDVEAGYVFVFLTLYIVSRVLFARYRKYLPLFRTVETMKLRARESRQKARSLFVPPVETPAPEQAVCLDK